MFLSVIQCLLLVNMDILDLEMEQRSRKIDTLKNNYDEMEERTTEAEQVRTTRTTNTKTKYPNR